MDTERTPVIDPEAGHGYAYGGGGLIALVIVVLLLIWIL